MPKSYTFTTTLTAAQVERLRSNTPADDGYWRQLLLDKVERLQGMVSEPRPKQGFRYPTLGDGIVPGLSMHPAGLNIMLHGWKYPLALCQPYAQWFLDIFNAGKPVPDLLNIEIDHHWVSVMITVIDGECRGVGLYVFFTKESDREAITTVLQNKRSYTGVGT